MKNPLRPSPRCRTISRSAVAAASALMLLPLAAGANGAFDVVATQHFPLLMPVSGVYPQVHLVGTVSGITITLHEVSASGAGTAYTVTYSQPAPTFNGACPG